MADQALTTSGDVAPTESKLFGSYLSVVVVAAIGILEIGWIAMIGWGGLWLIGY